RPLATVVVVFVVLGISSLATGGAVLQTYTGACVLVLPYALFRWGSGREAVVGFAVILADVGVAALRAGTRPASVVEGAAVVLAAMALGAVSRFGAGARLREFDQVKARERERLARDLHDTVAHHVSAIAIRAQAGLATAQARPRAAIEALEVISAEASRTLA